MTEASERVAKAQALVAKWQARVEELARQAEVARAKGKAEKADELDRKARAALRHAAAAVATVAKYTPIANLADQAMSVARRGEKAAKRMNTARQRDKRKERRAATVKVASPFGNGFDQVKATGDTVASMRRRRQITPRQADAAERFREAWDQLNGGLGSTLDPDRGGGGGATNKTPSSGALWAAGVMREADALIGGVDGAVLRSVVGEGLTIKEMAARSYGAHPSEREVKFVGLRLRESLDMLADRWFPISSKKRIVAAMEPDAMPTAGKAGTVEVSAVAHASTAGVTMARKRIDNRSG